MSNIKDLLLAKIAAKQAALEAQNAVGLPKAQPSFEAPTSKLVTELDSKPSIVEAASEAATEATEVVEPIKEQLPSKANVLLAIRASMQSAPQEVSSAPKVKQSLAERLAAKKALEADKALTDESEALPKELLTEVDHALDARVFEQPKKIHSLKEALAAAKEHRIEAQAEAAKDPAKQVGPLPVIQTEQGFMSLVELSNEMARLNKLLTKIKSQAIVAKLAKLEEHFTNLEVQIDLEREAMAPDAGSPTAHLVLPHEEEHLHKTEIATSVESIGEVAVGYQGAFSLSVVLNERQLMAKEMALSGKSFCLIGPAGTGKTTAQRSVAEALLDQGLLKTTTFKITGSKERNTGPSFVAVAFTRRASSNLARAIHKDPKLKKAFTHNIMTIHALLEFEPVIFFDQEKQRESMRFEPQRDGSAPLEITHLVIEESSMLGLDLAEQLFDALPCGVQIIYIGDINQLPPVFGASILNYALVQLPVIELTEVYRNGGIILENAHNILKGAGLVEGETLDEDTGKSSKFAIVRGKSEQQVGQEKMAHSLGLLFKHWEEQGEYRPDEDMILSPFNKQALGTDNMNKWIAQFLGEKRKAIVFEIIAGFNTHYLAVGDRVMVNKQDGYITHIARNGDYLGKDAQLPGSDLSRFGMRIMGADTVSDMDELCDATLNYTNFNLDSLQEQDAERKQQASHAVEIVLESGETLTLKSAGDFGPASFSLGYVLTVHKAQGCEFRKVFILFHKDHNVMLTRELFYTAVTRAREEVCLIAKDWVIEKAVRTQRIKGNSLQEKIEYFNSGAVDMLGGVRCTK